MSNFKHECKFANCRIWNENVRQIIANCKMQNANCEMQNIICKILDYTMQNAKFQNISVK